MFLVSISGGDESEHYTAPCFIVRDETRASELVAEANEQIKRVREIARPTWSRHDPSTITDLSERYDAWEAERRSIMTIWPPAWSSDAGDNAGFEYDPIEERS